MADDSGLTTVMDIAATYNMASDFFFAPAFPLSLTDALPFSLCTILIFFMQPFVVVPSLLIFSQGNATAFALIDLAIFYDPSLAPMRPDHAFLISSRRRPLSCSFAHSKSRQGNIANSFSARIETRRTDGNLNIFLIWIFAVEVSINDRLIILSILLCIPCVY